MNRLLYGQTGFPKGITTHSGWVALWGRPTVRSEEAASITHEPPSLGKMSARQKPFHEACRSVGCNLTALVWAEG
jgi:hypothetical protein